MTKLAEKQKEFEIHNEAQAPVPAKVERDEPTSLLAVISRAASDPNCDVAKMRELLEMRRELERDDAKRQYAEAMNDVQKLIKPIAADASNPQTSSKYATYHALDNALRPIYTDHGFSVDFDTEESEQSDKIWVICVISHRAGHERRHKAPMPITTVGPKGNAVMTPTHATGSAIQYGKRYTLGMGFNIAIARDDDGNAAGAKPITPEQVQELIDLADDLGVDKEAFCKWAGVPGLADISAANFAKAKAAMQAKGKAQKAKADA
jgi:ERF superfamily protein